MHDPLSVMDVVGPLIGAAVFVLVMSRVTEPARRTFNAMFVAGATGAYLSSSFGIWELVFPAIAFPVAYAGLRSYRYIGIAWLMHAGWDLLHHRYGHPIWPFMAKSSFGCFVLDSAIAVWCLAGAPAVWRWLGPRRRVAPGV